MAKSKIEKTNRNKVSEKLMNIRKNKGNSFFKEYFMEAPNGLPAKNQKLRVWACPKGTPATQEFLSYGWRIAINTDGEIMLDIHKWNFTAPTARYLYRFLDKTSQEVQDLITDGTYQLIDMNYEY